MRVFSCTIWSVLCTPTQEGTPTITASIVYANDIGMFLSGPIPPDGRGSVRARTSALWLKNERKVEREMHDHLRKGWFWEEWKLRKTKSYNLVQNLWHTPATPYKVQLKPDFPWKHFVVPYPPPIQSIQHWTDERRLSWWDFSVRCYCAKLKVCQPFLLPM